MNTQIQDIEEELRELAEATEHAANKLAELRNPELRVGDVIRIHSELAVVNPNDRYTMLTGKAIGARPEYLASKVNEERLGTFDEVYMLRSEDRLQDFKNQITCWYDYDGRTIFDGGVDVSEFFAFVKSITLSR